MLEQLQKLSGIKEVSSEGNGTTDTTAPTANGKPAERPADAGRLPTPSTSASRLGPILAPNSSRLAVDRKWTLRELARRRATLEDVFVEITHAE